MAIFVHRFPAAQILRVDVLTEGRANVPFLNWRVVAKTMGHRNASRDAFAGAGIYAICFDDQLIYIGSFLGRGGITVGGLKAATFVGDVASGRWWQHFGSIIGRSHKLNVAPSTLAHLDEEFGPDHPMVVALRAVTPNLSKDAGCLGARERLRFAARHFAEFSGEHVEPTHVLPRFSYVYVRFDALPEGMNAYKLSRWIKDTETRLIESLHPAVNTAGRIAGQVPVRVDCSQVSARIIESLRQGQPDVPVASVQQDNPAFDPPAALSPARVEGRGVISARAIARHRPPHPPVHEPPAVAEAGPRPSARELFFRSIEDAPAATALVAHVMALCEVMHALVRHTYACGGDLRVQADRPAPNPRKQNVITMAWKPTKGYFACEALASPEECVEQGLPFDGVRPNTATLSSLLNVRPGIDDEAFLSIVSLSLQRFREQ